MVATGRFFLSAALLWLLWDVLVGTTQSTELIAGAGAAIVAAGFVEALRLRGLLDATPSLRIAARAWSIPTQVVFDFALVLWIVVRDAAHGRRVRGVWVRVDYRFEPGRVGRFQRALVATLENETANGIVVDLDRDSALLHALDTRVSTGRSVL